MSLNPRPNQHDIFNQDSTPSHKRTSLDAPALDLGNIPTPPPTPLTPPTQNQNLAQNTQDLPTPQMPITPPTNTQTDTTGDKPNTPPAQKEIFANDVVSDEQPKPYPTSKMRKLSLNAQVINAINAENADEALDFLSTQDSNIDWEQVAQARASGVKSHEILSQIASATATNPRAMWINIDTPLSKGELARAKFDYERSQISDDELKNLKEQTSLNQFKSLSFWLGLDDEKKRQANLTLAKFAESSQSYEDLPQEAKSLLNVQGKDSYSLNVRSIFTGKSEGELLYEQKQKQAKIYQKIKNKEHLSDDELDYIDSYGEGAGFGNNAEKQKQWLLKYEAQNIIPSYTQNMVFALENKADYKALFFGSGKGKERDKERFLQGLEGIAKVSGFDSASVDEKNGDIFFEKEGFAYQVNTRFLDNIDNMLKANAFSIGGSIAGSIAGAKALGKNPASLITGVVGGGALGAFVGGTLDGVLADLYTNNQINFAENLRHGLHEGIFNIAGDALVGGVIKGGKVLAKAAKNFTPQGLKDTLASTAQSAKNLTNKIMEYSIVGQAAKNVFDGNVSAVRSFLRQIPKDERESIKQGIKDFGLELELNPKSNQALNNFISKHGQSHPHLANTAQKVYDVFTLPAGKELQQELLSSIRADNTGALLGFLSEAANSSPSLQKSLHSILNQTHARAINHLKSFGLKQNDIAQVFEAYQKGTKEAYSKALDMIQEVFKSEKTQVSRKQYDSLVSELKASALDEKELNYLKTLESKIYGNGENGSPRSFENLKDALSLLNEKWGKHAKNMNFTAEKLRRVERQMREDIKQGINAIFDGSPQGASFRELFESALSDYGNMKGILKAVDKLKLRDTSIAYQKTLDKMLDFLIAGEKGEFSNLAKLTEHLPKEQKIKFELATLNALLEKSIFSAKNGQSKVLEVFNSGEFLARLESIAGEFSTPQAREYIDFVKEFHNLFKNDYAISKATLEPALTQKMGGGIATTPTGRFEYQRAKLIYDSIIRLMPHIPFMSNFNEKISGAAVRYHLKSALRKSHSVSELKRTLNAKLASGKFDSPTSKVIAQMLDGVESSQEQIIKELNANGGSDIGGNSQNPHTAQADSKISPSRAQADTGGGFDLVKSKLESAPAQPTPSELKQAELESVLAQFDNVENIKKHFAGKPDEKQRYALFSLVQDTLLDPLIKYTSAGKQKYLQKFASTNESEPFFYMLVTQDKDKTFITHLKTRDTDYLLKDLVQANEIQKGADLIGEFTSWGGSSKATPPTSTNRISGDNAIIQESRQNLAKNDQIKQDIFSLAKQEKQAKEQAELAKKQADSEFIAAREAQKQARLDKLLAAQRDSQGSTTLEARAKIKAEQMGEDIPYTRLSDTHIILDDITYPAEFVMIDKKDLKPSFEAGGFQTREVKQESKIAQIRDNFDPLKIFGKVGEYDGLPLIARNGEIIAGNHRGEAIKNLSGENLARYNEYAKKVFGIDLPQDKIIVRRILDDTQSPQGANLLEQIALAARSNKGAESTLGEQATSALGTYKDKIQKELLENPARRYIESDSVDNQMQAVANLLNAPLKAEEANLGLLASLSKASHNLDIAKALDMIEGDDLLKAKIKNMLIANAGGFYNISRSIATPKLNEITNYLVDAIAYLGKASKQSGTENINRSEAYRELASKINDRASGKVRSFAEVETPLDEFVAQAKADVLGASLSKFANQDHASQRLYEALRDMPSILEEKFSTPSFDFFGNGGNKALKEVDMYDFLDYMIGRGQQNEATSQLKDALLELKKLESSTPPNNTPPNSPNPSNFTPPNTNTHADNAITLPASAEGHAQISPSSAQAVSKTPPSRAQADKGSGLFDLPSQASQAQKANPTQSRINKDEVLQNLQHLPSTPLPKEVSEAEFLEQGLEKVVNKSSFLAHQKTKSDAHTRLKYLNLIKPTLENKDITLKTLGKNGEDRKAYLKVFEYGNSSDKKLFYTLITEQDDSYLITGYPISKIKEVERVIKNAQSVEYFGRPTEALGTATEKNASSLSEIIPNSAQKTQDPQELRLKELESSLDYRFENKFRKQAEQELGKDLDYTKWLDTQREKGNKEILEYDKDLAEYRKLDNALRQEKQAKADKEYTQKYQKEWLERYKPAYVNKTDEEIIATQGKQAGKSYDEAKHLLATMRKDIERNLDLHPLAEFGTNYAEFYQDGKGAIEKLIAEASAAKQAGQDFSGQVAGAFSKEIDGAMGSIDLVWGNEKMGLEKIIQKHLDDFSDFSGANPHEKVANGLSEIISKGEVIEKDGVKTIWLKNGGKNYVVGLSKGWKGNGENLWIITSYEKTKGYIPNLRGDSLNLSAYKAEFNPLLTSSDEPLSKEISKKATPAQNFDQVASKVQSGDNLSTSGDNQIIQKISQKFNKDENFAKNLYEWHKDSHPITKEADGTPKVFYHGAKVAKGKDIKIFDTKFSNISYEHGHLEKLPFCFFFSSDLKTAKGYTYSHNESVKKVFLKAKNPLIIDFEGKTYNQGIDDAISQMGQDFKQGVHDAIIYKNIIDDSEQDTTKINKIADTFAVFDSNQIKAVDNKGTFEATNPNIYHSSSTAGGGVLGGTIAGVERDDEGNIIGFSPEKFALGFAGGAAGAKALGSIFKQKQAQNHALKSIKNLQKEYQALQAHNLPLFAKIMSDIPPQTFIKPSKEAKRLSNDIFNKELAQVIQNAIDKDSIKELPQANFKNISEFRGLFDEVKNNIGYLATPLGKIRVNTQYALHHFTNNTYYKDRTNIKGGFFETFKNPLFIVEDDTKGKGSIYFYKPFYDKDKNMLNLFGIGVNQKGIINFRTYYLDEKKSRLKQLLKSEGVRIKYVAKE